MSHHPTSFEGSIPDAIRDAIIDSLGDAEVEVTGGGGHFTVSVVSRAFEGKKTLESHRMVYAAIAHLMAGDGAPVHAVDKLTTQTP